MNLIEIFSNIQNLSYKDAVDIQKQLVKKISFNLPKNFKLNSIAGVDISFNKFEKEGFATIVILDRNLKIIEEISIKDKLIFPYIPGLLAFREIPLIIKAFEKLKIKPDIIICDGHGIAHPRKMGIATMLGLTLNIPTIGVAKKKLHGNYKLPAKEKGSFSYLKDDNDEIIGIVYRSKTNCNPIFISVGHLIDLETAFKIVKTQITNYKLPTATRLAHILVNKARKNL